MGTISLGTTLGALGSLIGFPGALAAVFFFHAELIDLVTRPDVTAKLREITFRCAYRFKPGPLFEAYQKDSSMFGKICRTAPLGVSFSYVIHNEDAIERSLQGLRVLVDTPELGQQDLAFAFDVEHVVRGGFDETIQRPWFVRRLAPNYSATYEALMLVDTRNESASDIPFATFIQHLQNKPEVFSDASHEFRLYGQVDDSEIELAVCDWKFSGGRIDEFLKRPAEEQYQLTGYCNTL